MKKMQHTRNTSGPGALIDLLGRVGLVAIFLLAGVNKIQAYDGSAAYMASAGIPGGLLPLVILFEIGSALAILFGYQTRLWALAVAGFTLLTALIFHNNLTDHMQFLMFWKNIAIAGGFLVLAANGAGHYSLDARRR